MKTVEEIKEKIENLKIKLNNLPRKPINISALTGGYYYADDKLISTVIDVLEWVLEDSEDVKEDIKWNQYGQQRGMNG